MAERSNETKCCILFPRRTRAPLKDRRDPLNIAHQLNRVFPAAKVPTHITILRRNYNEKSNLSCLMAHAGTSSMLLPQHQKLVMKVATKFDNTSPT